MAIKITEDSSGPEEVHTQDLDEEEVSTAMLDRSEMQLSVTLEQAPKKARKVTQIMAVVAVSVGAFIHGTVVSFPAVAVPSIKASNASFNASEEMLLESNDNDSISLAYMPFLVYEENLALIVSIASFGMLFGSLSAGPCANFIGRKWTSILGTCGSLAIGYSLFSGAQYIWMFLLGRFMQGAGLGFSTTVSTIYIMEVATPNMRGSLAVIPAIAGTLGLLATQILGAYLNWQWLSIVCASLNVPFLIFLFFIPESPVYLIHTEQIETAHRVLRILRGPHWDITKELTDIKVASEGRDRERYKVTYRDFLSSTVLQPFLLALTLMFFFQFSGINVILQYTVDIFQSADSSVEEFQATIFVGISLLISNVITLIVANKMPRRLMLILSSFGISGALIGMGVYFHFKSLELEACGTGISAENCEDIYTHSIRWLPLLLLMIYIFFFNLGYGAMIWITVVEILPLHVRSVATSLSVAFTCVCSFLTSHTYTDLKDNLSVEGVFWLYGSISFAGLLFILIFIPETKGKTATELRDYFTKRSRKPTVKERKTMTGQQRAAKMQ